MKMGILYTGDNLAEVLNYFGKHPKWDRWFSSFEDYQKHVHENGNTFRLFYPDTSYKDFFPGDYIEIDFTLKDAAKLLLDDLTNRYRKTPVDKNSIAMWDRVIEAMKQDERYNRMDGDPIDYENMLVTIFDELIVWNEND